MKRKLGPEDMHRIMDRAAAAAEAAVQYLRGSQPDKGAAGASGSRSEAQ